MEAVCMPKDFGGWCVYLVCGVFIWWVVCLSGGWCVYLVGGVFIWWVVCLSGVWCVYLVCGVFIWCVVCLSSVKVTMVAALEATPIRMDFIEGNKWKKSSISIKFSILMSHLAKKYSIH